MVHVMRSIRALALGLAFLGLTATSGPAFAETVRNAVDAANRVFLAGFAAGDSAKMASVYTDDAVVFPPGGERVIGRAAIAQFWQGFLKSGVKNLGLKTLEVESQGNLAVESGEFGFDMPGKDGKMTKAGGKYIVVWKRVQGRWQIYRDIWNDLPAR